MRVRLQTGKGQVSKGRVNALPMVKDFDVFEGSLEHIVSACSVSVVGKPALRILRRDGVERLADGSKQVSVRRGHILNIR